MTNHDPHSVRDIAFSAMVARMIFPPAHPAIPFLLLLAIADDALGLIILAVLYPSGHLSLSAPVALMVTAVLVALWLRRRRTQSFWPYVLGPGGLSWAALYFGGLHPALALVPVVPFMPHSPSDLGLFEPREEQRPDTLNRFEHWWATPVQFVLLLFGFANAGVPFEQVGPGTYYVLAALLLGKPIGILLFSTIARLAGASLPQGLRTGDLLVVGVVASIGFAVSLFFATAAFPAGKALDGLARRWTPRLLRYAARVLGGSSDAAETARDVVQEVWIGVIRGLRGLRDPAQFPAWIYGITTRKCADVIRTNVRKRRRDVHSAAGRSGEETGLTPEYRIDVAKAIRGLPPTHRAVVHLFYREETSVEEIASILEIPVGTVKSRLHSARETLREQMNTSVPDRAEAKS